MADQTTPSSSGSEEPACILYTLSFKYSAPGDENIFALIDGYDKYDWLKEVTGNGNIDDPFILPRPARYTIKLGFKPVSWTEAEKSNDVHVPGQEVGKAYNAFFSGANNATNIHCLQAQWQDSKPEQPIIRPVKGIVLGSKCYLHQQGVYEITVVFKGRITLVSRPLSSLSYNKPENSRNLKFYVKMP